MKESVQRLMLMGFGIIIMAFLIISNASAQAKPYVYMSAACQAYNIQSRNDYLRMEQVIEDIADELYTLHQEYADLDYRLHYGENEALVSVTVTGIADHKRAEEIAFYIGELEAMGNAISRADLQFLPEASGRKDHRLNRREAMQYVPEIKPKVKSDDSMKNLLMASIR